MKVCAIRDEYENRNTVLGYLFYYERSSDFFIELRDDLDAGEFPILLSLFVQKRTYSIGREWSARWVQARIVPRDRQNLGAILRDNGLSEYDPYRLLILGNGRCSQDECAVFPVREAELPEWLHRRRQKKAAGVASLSGRRMLVSFRDGAVALADLKIKMEEDRRFARILREDDIFSKVQRLPGGHGITWGEGTDISSEWLRENGIQIPLTGTDLYSALPQLVTDTGEVCEKYLCSRQYVEQMAKKGRITAIKNNTRGRQFLRYTVDDAME